MADDDRNPAEDVSTPEYARQRSGSYSRSVLDDLMAEDDDFHDLDEEELYDDLDDEFGEADRLPDPEPSNGAPESAQVSEGTKKQVENGGPKQEAPKVSRPPPRVHETRSSDVKPVRETYSARPERNGDMRGYQQERPWPAQPRPQYSHRQPKHGVRYFIIKSVSHRNIATSIEKGVWATQAINEGKLNQAFETAGSVILVFSVNQSGHFQGYARMASPIGRSRSSQWSENEGGGGPWGGDFSVEWLQLYDLSFNKTLHLRNPLNEMKPIKISRDGQELPAEIGEVVCALMDEGAESEGRGGKRAIVAGEYKTKDAGPPDEDHPFEGPPPGPIPGRGFGRGIPRPAGRGFNRPPFQDGPPRPRPEFGPGFREPAGFRPGFPPRGYRDGPYMEGPMGPRPFARGRPYPDGPGFVDGPGFRPPFQPPFEDGPPPFPAGYEGPFSPYGYPPYREGMPPNGPGYGAEMPGYREGYVRRRSGSPPARGRSRSRSQGGGYSDEERPRKRSPPARSKRRSRSRSRSPKKEKRKKSKRRSESPPPRSKKVSPPPEDLLNMSYEEYVASMAGASGGYPPEQAYPGEYGRDPYGGAEEMYGPEAYYRSQGYWPGPGGQAAHGRRPM